MPLRLLFAISLALGNIAPGLAHAQSTCRAADTRAQILIQYVARYSSAVSGDTKIVRDSLRLPFVPESEIVIVTQETTCRKVKTAYQSFFANTGNNTFSGQLYVLKVGTVYAVEDPAYRHDPDVDATPILFLDSRFKPLSTTL